MEKFIVLFCLLSHLASFQTHAQRVKKYYVTGNLNTNYTGAICLRYDMIPDSPGTLRNNCGQRNFHF